MLNASLAPWTKTVWTAPPAGNPPSPSPLGAATMQPYPTAPPSFAAFAPPQPPFRFEHKPFPVVRLRGLPFNAGELDVGEFFQARR